MHDYALIVAKIAEPPSSEITPPAVYARRRDFLKRGAAFLGTAGAWGTGLVALSSRGQADVPLPEAPGLDVSRRGRYGTDETRTPFDAIVTYNNYYELGLSKSEPAENAHTLKPRPWSVAIEGEVDKPEIVDIEKLLGWFDLEERIYRMRCVEAWSMVIPWVGFPLADLIRRVAPTSRAKYVEMTTLLDREQLPGQSRPVLPWPYVEALGIDEATNPLTMLAVGLYDQVLLGQNGAPLRLVVPWKYGFKGVKSIVRIRFTETRPKTTWNRAAPREYGFFANVNPNVDHPRWSQATERRIGELGRRDTLPFNGYAEHVAHMYADLDLVRNY